MKKSEGCLKTTEEVAEEEKQKAIENNYPDPYFDFRDYYVKNDEIFYVYVNEWIGEKELLSLHIRTVYARTFVAYEDNAQCHVIGYTNKDRIFKDKAEAQKCYKQIKIKALYGEKIGDRNDSE